MDACADVSGISPNEKLVLLILARFKNEETGDCYPSITTLSKTTCLSASSVRRALDSLRKKELISGEKRFNKFGFVWTWKFNIKKTPCHSDRGYHSDRGCQSDRGYHCETPTPVTVTPVPYHGDTPTPVTVTPEQGIVTNKRNKEMTTSKLNRLAVEKTIGLTDEQLDKICYRFKDHPDAISEIQRVLTMCIKTKWLGISNPYSYIIGVGQREVEKWDGFVARCDASEQMRREPAYA